MFMPEKCSIVQPRQFIHQDEFQTTVEPRFYAPRFYANLDFTRKIFGPGKNSFKISKMSLDFTRTFKETLDFMRTFKEFSILRDLKSELTWKNHRGEYMITFLINEIFQSLLEN